MPRSHPAPSAPTEDLAAEAMPLDDGPRLAVDLADIPLPPAEIAAAMLAEDAEPAGDGPEPEIATLDFFGDDLPSWTRVLTYPFRWEGVPHTAITVRQLTTAEVGEIFRKARAAGRMPDLYDVYARMTGLPAKVLRALPAVDGDPITEKAWDFLPPSLRPESASTSASTTS